jgi:dTDP-glucose pyrophosphorylase
MESVEGLQERRAVGKSLLQREKMINVLLPMSGRGSRFDQTGRYSFPKPLIEIQGKPMIQVVVENLNVTANYIFLVQKEHYDKYALQYLLPLITKPNSCTVIVVDGITEGAACTALLAKGLIDNDEELLIANSDQYVVWDREGFFKDVADRDSDAAMLTFEACHPKWSFIKLDEKGFGVEVAEKKPISNVASTGIYWFKQGKAFVKAAEQMMMKEECKVLGEWYIAPTFNEIIADGGRVTTFTVEMHGLGTPADYEAFLASGIKV